MSEQNQCQQCGAMLDPESVDRFCSVCAAVSEKSAVASELGSLDQPTMGEPDALAGIEQRTECLSGSNDFRSSWGEVGNNTEASLPTPFPEGQIETTQEFEGQEGRDPPEKNETSPTSSHPVDHSVTAEFLPVEKTDAENQVTLDHPRANPGQAPAAVEGPTLPWLDFLTPCDKPDLLGLLGRYEISGVIGRGGMGIVLHGYDPTLERVVAIKVLTRELAANATARKRFVREGKTAASVKHDHVVAIHAVEPGEKVPFLVMRYIDGPSLMEKLEKSGPLGVEQIVRVGHEIALGLAAAHANNLVHRDIKPSNILLEGPTEIACITDFGLARAIDDIGVTQTGVVTGTPEYMSPEQAQGRKIDHRSDLFSLGCVLYAACTGRSPFRARSPLAAIRRVCDDMPRPIWEVNPDVSDWLVDIIDKLLEKDPDRRFQTAAEVADLLGRHLAHLKDPHNEPRPVGLRKSRRKTGRRVLITAAVVLLLLGVPMVSELAGWTHVIDTVIANLYEEQSPVRQAMGLENEEPKDNPREDKAGNVNDKQEEQRKQAEAKRKSDALRDEQLRKVAAETKRKRDAREMFTTAKQLTTQRAWKEAALAYQKGLELDPSDSVHWIHCAPLWLQMGDIEAYKSHCQKMLQQFGETDPRNAGRIAQVCDLSTQNSIPPATIERLAKLGLNDKTVNPGRSPAYGITLFRLGKHAEACEQIEKSPGAIPIYMNARSLPVLAMARAQQGLTSQAYQALGEAKTLLQTMAVDANKLMAEQLLREAQEKLPTVSEPMTFAGTLTVQDPKDQVQKTSFQKIYPVNLQKDVSYLIDLEGDFDTILRVEDANSKTLLSNDNVSYPNLNSRLVFLPPTSGTYQLIVTSYDPQATGRFTLSTQKIKRTSDPTVWNGQLSAELQVQTTLPTTKDTYFAKRLFGLKEIALAAESTTRISLESTAFNPDLLLLDPTGTRIVTRSSGSGAQVSVSPLTGGKYHLLVTSTKESQQGSFRLNVESFATPPAKRSTDVWLSKARTYQQKNDLTNALKSYALAMQLNPQNAALYRESAQLYAQKKMWNSATEYLEKTLKLDPRDFEAWRQLLALLQATGKTERYHKLLSEGVDRFSEQLLSVKTTLAWSTPVNLGKTINTPYYDTGPCLSADGLTLHFHSDRPGGLGSQDIWMSARDSIDAAWGQPVHVGGDVSTSADERGPFLSANGLTLLFSSTRVGGQGDADLWMCTRPTIKDEWSRAVNLGPAVNSPGYDEYPSLTADGLTLLFGSDRAGGHGRSDLWMCTRKTTQEPWGPAVNLTTLNSKDYDGEPSLSQNGLMLLFVSMRPGGIGSFDIWMSSRTSKESPWTEPVCLGPEINSTSYDGCPTLSSNGNLLILHSGRTPNEGSGDLWMSRRVQPATSLQKLFLTVVLTAEMDGKPLVDVKKWAELIAKQPAELKNSPWSTLVQAGLAHHERRTEDARQLLNKVIATAPQENQDAARFQLFRALLSCRLGDAKTGWHQFKKGNDLWQSVAAKKGNADWAEKLSMDWLRGQAEKITIAQLNEAVAKAPDNADLLHERATLLVYLGRFEEAAKDVAAILRKEPDRLSRLDVPAKARLEFATALDQLRNKAGESLTRTEKDLLQKGIARLIVLVLADATTTISPDHEPFIKAHAEPICQELLTNHFNQPLASTRLASLLSSWKLFQPTGLKSLQGATLTLQNDGTIVVSGLNFDTDSYVLEGPIGLQKFTGIRLETIPDPSSPSKGASRFSHGNFHLTEIAARYLPQDGSQPLLLPFQQADASYVRPLSHDDHTTPLDRPQSTIDGKHAGRWDVHPQVQSSHNLVIATASPVAIGEGKLVVEMHFLEWRFMKTSLGRFRLWVTDVQNPLAALREVPASGWHSLAWTYMAQRQPQRALTILEKLKADKDVSAATWSQLALARKMLGKDGEAKADYEQAITLWKTEPVSSITDSLARYAAREVAGLSPQQVEWLIGELRTLPPLNVDIQKNLVQAAPWQNRGRFYAWVGKWQEAAADYNKAIELAPATNFGQHGDRSRITVELSQWPEAFAEVARGRSKDADVWLGHGRYHILRSQWQKALDSYNKAKAIRSLSVPFEEAYEYAALLLLVGDLKGYQRFVRETARNFSIQTPNEAFVMARMASLSSRSLEDFRQAVVWGEKSNKQTPWHLHALGLAYYRAGEFPKAITAFTQSSSKNWADGPLLNHFGLALACFRLDQTQKAEQWLDKARQEHDSIKPGVSRLTAGTLPTDWLEAEILHRELNALLEERRLCTTTSALAGLVGRGWDSPFALVAFAAESVLRLAPMEN